MHHLSSSKLPRSYGKVLLAATALASLLVLPACGDSAFWNSETSQANATATQSSNIAARRAASASEARPTESLIRKVESAKLPKQIKDLNNEIETKVSTDPSNAKDYIEQPKISDELAECEKLLNKALGGGTKQPEAEFKALVYAHIGHTNGRQAQMQLDEISSLHRDLYFKARNILTTAERIETLATEATRLEQRTSPPGLELKDAPKVDEVKNQAEAAKTESDKAAAAVATLEEQIKTKKAEANTLYDQSRAAAQAADQAKGLNSIDDFKKAMDVRGKADALVAEITDLETKLRAATHDAQAAKIAADRFATSLASLSGSTDAVSAAHQKDVASAAELRTAATELIENKETGLEVQLRDFKNLASKINEGAGQAVIKAVAADKAYQQAVKFTKDYGTHIKQDYRERLDPKDPLINVAEDRRAEAILTLLCASSSVRAGQAHLINWSTANTQTTVADRVARAYKALGSSIVPPADGKTTAEAAAGAGKVVLELATTTLTTALSIPGRDDGPARWLGYWLRAAANRDLALLTEDAAKQKELSDNAVKDVAEALSRNPNLDLTAEATPKP